MCAMSEGADAVSCTGLSFGGACPGRGVGESSCKAGWGSSELEVCCAYAPAARASSVTNETVNFLGIGVTLYVLFLDECQKGFQNDPQVHPRRIVFRILDVELFALLGREFACAAALFDLPQPGESGRAHKTVDIFVAGEAAKQNKRMWRNWQTR